jgi:hypothetical protein
MERAGRGAPAGFSADSARRDDHPWTGGGLGGGALALGDAVQAAWIKSRGADAECLGNAANLRSPVVIVKIRVADFTKIAIFERE